MRPEAVKEVWELFKDNKEPMTERVMDELFERDESFNGSMRDLSSVIQRGLGFAMDETKTGQRDFYVWEIGLIDGLGYGLETLIGWMMPEEDEETFSDRDRRILDGSV
jgi:hypothetical protein